MLHITIIHNTDGTHYIEEIYYEKELLAKFDEKSEKINLDILVPFLSEGNTEAKIYHYFLDDNEESYTVDVTIQEVAVDETTGLKYISYVTK